ncbi:electron carrier [Cyanidiococcus yangmingshanensis]|uniref:Electron carrier n=1 Tax=Cyanidiococcus yangmingshanensis TaxID=2690220 RepID=A0A7J7IM50_9RHOD|nr:electron carrier [Cyanidiococcus yangmingshanensis]
MTLCATRPPDEVKVGGVFRVPDAALSSEYIDEEELLPSTELDGSRDQTANGLARSDCSGAAVFAARQPCANCTCGRREQGQVDRAAQAVPLKQSVSMTNEEASSKTTGSCNKCHLGDAFRCASCPYLGLPPFKPGAPLKIESSLLEGDL